MIVLEIARVVFGEVGEVGVVGVVGVFKPLPMQFPWLKLGTIGTKPAKSWLGTRKSVKSVKSLKSV